MTNKTEYYSELIRKYGESLFKARDFNPFKVGDFIYATINEDSVPCIVLGYTMDDYNYMIVSDGYEEHRVHYSDCVLQSESD